jgi:hypothetical protein
VGPSGQRSWAEAGGAVAAGWRWPLGRLGLLRELGCNAGARLGRKARGAGLPSEAGPDRGMDGLN